MIKESGFFSLSVLLPSLFRAEQKIFFSKMIYENPYNEPILYLDEWFKEIASGRLSNSMTDEKRTPHKALSPRLLKSRESVTM